MKINVGDFGYKVPDGTTGAQAGAASFVQPGLKELGAAGMQVGKELAQGDQLDQQIKYREAHERRVEAETVAKEAKRAEAMTIHARAQNDLAAEHDRIAQGVQDGSISVDQAPKLWSESSAKIVDDHLATVDKANTELVRSSLVGNVGTFGRSISQAITTRNKQTIGASLIDYREQMERFALTDPDTAKKQYFLALDAQGPLAGLNPQQVAKDRQSFAETVTFNSARQSLNASMNDAAALDGFIARLPEMADLSPDKRNALESMALHMKSSLESKAVAAENRRLAKVQTVGKKLETRIAMGVPVDAADIDTLVTAAKGTPYEDYARGLSDQQKSVSELLKKPLREQADYVSHLEQELFTTGKGDPALVHRLRQTVDHGIKLYSTNSMQYAMNRTGAPVEALDMATPQSWAANLSHRADIWNGLDRQMGVKPGGPLFPAEVQTISDMLRSGPIATKRMVLGTLREGLDQRPYLAAMQQLAPDNPALAAAGVAAFRGDERRADAIIRGLELVRPSRKEDGQPVGGKVLPMPKDDEFEKAWASRARDAFAGNAEVGSIYLQTARAVYAKLTDDAGDLSGTLNGSRFDDAIREATGGFEKYRGRQVVLPHNMSYAQFRDGLKERLGMLSATKQLAPEWTVDKLLDLPLQNRGDMSYILRAGDGKVVDKTGRDVVIDFGQAMPFKTSGER